MIRPAVQTLLRLGPFPSEQDDAVTAEDVGYYADLINTLKTPITNEEATQLVTLFGNDNFWGIAGSLRHVVETAPDWPIWSCLTNVSNEWIQSLRQAAMNAGYHPED